MEAQPPQYVSCSTCGATNDASQGACAYCGAALYQVVAGDEGPVEQEAHDAWDALEHPEAGQPAPDYEQPSSRVADHMAGEPTDQTAPTEPPYEDIYSGPVGPSQPQLPYQAPTPAWPEAPQTPEMPLQPPPDAASPVTPQAVPEQQVPTPQGEQAPRAQPDWGEAADDFFGGHEGTDVPAVLPSSPLPVPVGGTEPAQVAAPSPICPTCGASIVANVPFCPTCGTEFTTATLPESDEMPGIIVGPGGLTQTVQGVVTVGRDPRNTLALADPSISRAHCRFDVRAGTVLLSDLGSTNGTWLNGRRIDHDELADGDLILVGRTELRYRSTADADQAQLDITGS